MCSDKSIVDIVHNEVSHTKDGRTLSKDEIASLILIIVMVFFIVQVFWIKTVQVNLTVKVTKQFLNKFAF